MLKNKLVLNIPHSSSNIPDLKWYHLTIDQINKEILKLTDWYTDDLFFSKDDYMIVADFSRIYCDTERFLDDNLEIMSKVGMWVLYTKTDDWMHMKTYNNKMKKEIINNFYKKHHDALTNAIEKELRKSGKTLIVDCHSFSNIPLKRDIDKTKNRPDICIGTDNFHTPNSLINFSQNYFSNLWYLVWVNSPYEWTIVPMKYYKKNKNVSSIMIELNKKLYLKPWTNEKSELYNKLKKNIEAFLIEIKSVMGETIK